jgi:hypothetical protein
MILVRYVGTTDYRVYLGGGTTQDLSTFFSGKESQYPDAIERIEGLDSERSGDIILVANYSYDDAYSNYFAGDTMLGEHGNLNAEDTFVPLIISGPTIKKGETPDSARTIDIAPTIASILGFGISNTDGSVLPIQYLPLPGSLRGFVKDGEYFQTTVDVGSIPKLGITLTFIPIGGNDIDLRVISPSAKVYGFGGITEEDGFAIENYITHFFTKLLYLKYSGAELE